MYTLFGKEAKEGDYVLVHDVQYVKGSAKIHIAQVKDNKAYATEVVLNSGKGRWLRKESAVIIIPASDVSEFDKALIQMNMDAEKATFDMRSDYGKQVFKLVADAADAKTEERVARYGEEYRYR